MKNKGGHNEFDRNLLSYWFGDNHECWFCGMNNWDCYHHVIGRGGQDGCEKSILNACPIHNNKCHLPIHSLLRSEENTKIFLQKTVRYLLKKGYEFNDIDLEFIEKYKYYYL